jgi:hypothetical protein
MITPSFGLTATERVLPRLALDWTTGVAQAGVEVARLGTATYISSAQTLEEAAENTQRVSLSNGVMSLLAEESRINSVRNNTMQGAAVSPFTPPTNWGAIPAVAGLTVSIPSIGTENGINYIDIRLVGTATGLQVIAFETTTGITAVNGETWTTSFYCKLVAGSLANVVHFKPRVTERTSAGGFVVAVNGDAFTPTGANLILQRQVYVRTLAGGGTVGRLQPGIEYSVDGAVDFTIRVGLPQCEKGASASSVIKTSTAAVTRNADVPTITGSNFDFFNASAGTFFVNTNAQNADVLLTAGGYSLSADATGLKKYATTYTADPSATELTIGKGSIQKILYYKQALIAAELAALVA